MKEIILEMGRVRSSIIGDYPHAKTRIELSFRPEGYQFAPTFQRGHWDGRIGYLTKNGTYPSGLTYRLYKFLESIGYKVRVKATYDRPPAIKKKDMDCTLKGMKARKYQLEAAWTALNKHRGVIKLPTAAGKTVIAILIIKNLNGRVLFLTNLKDIFHQTAKRFANEFGEGEVGLVGDGYKQLSRRITVGMVQTLIKIAPAARKVLLTGIDIFIGDEIHHSKAKTWKKTIDSCPALYRIGLTATPGEGSKAMPLEAVTGRIIYEKTVTDLASKGFLSLPTILMSRISKPTVSNRLDYHQAFREGIVENLRRNERIISVCHGLIKYGHGPVLVFSTSIEQLVKLWGIAFVSGLNYNTLTGKNTSYERMKTIGEMKAGKLDVLFVSTIFDEGVDIPNVGSVVMAAVGKNKTKLIQRLGRGMRIANGKKTFIVVDFYDDTCKYLLNHSKHRRSIYKKEGYQWLLFTVGARLHHPG